MDIDNKSAKNGVVSRRTLLATAAAGAALVAAGRTAGVALAEDAISAARFSIEIDGVQIASFSELESLVSEIDTTDFLTATGAAAKKLPGKRQPPTLTLKRSQGSLMEIWAWHEAVLSGDASALKNCSLVMYSVDGSPVARYALEQAFPSKIEIDGLTTGAAETLMETVTMVCEHIQRVSP